MVSLSVGRSFANLAPQVCLSSCLLWLKFPILMGGHSFLSGFTFIFPMYSNVFPMYFLWLKSCYPWTSHFSRSNSSPPGLGAEFQGGRRQSQLLLVSRLSYLGSLCGASDHCGYQVRSSEGSGRCNLMVSEVTIITIYMDGHFTSLVDFLLIDGIY